MNSEQSTTMERKTSEQTAGDTSHSCPAICSASLPPVLDACCGKRAMWFDPQDNRAVFVDRRRETLTVDMRPGRKPWVINPDIVADFTELPFPDNTFRVVAFDPPHASFGKTSYMAQYYGTLQGEWREMLRKGFAECFRVLKPEGVLIFKWNETQVPIGEILKLTPEKPMFGQKTGRATGTHWVTFLKPNRYSAKPRFGLSRQCHFAGFVLYVCNQPGCVKMTGDRFGLSREGGFGTWHGALVNAPHVER